MKGALLLFAAAAAGSADLPQFSFREHRTGAQYDVASLHAAGCKDTDQGISCESEDSIAGTRAFIDYLVVNGRLSRFNVSGFEIAIERVLPALYERYGKPCAESTETVSNRLGGTFPSKTVTWCFASGELVFHQRWGSIDTYSLRYADRVVVPPARKTAPDF